MTEEERRRALKERLERLGKQVEKWKNDKGGADNGTGKTN
jgi:hypothetical protein